MPLLDRSAMPLLAPDEPAPVEALAGPVDAPILLVCDHASRRLPRALGSLGLGEAARASHIAWDIGADALTHALARRLGAPALIAGYSRLAVDLNRSPDNPSLIPDVSHGATIPGNRGLADDARSARLAALYAPYHDAIAAHLDAAQGRSHDGAHGPCVVAIHSFTPDPGTGPRPWHVGVLWNRDGRMPRPLIDRLQGEGDLIVGDNQPYAGYDGFSYTTDAHGEARGLACAAIEVRQDLLATPAAIEAWAERLARVLRGVLQDLDGA